MVVDKRAARRGVEPARLGWGRVQHECLTTSPNGVVGPIHAKAMPVLIRTKDEAEQWLEVPAEEALQLQKRAPDDAIVMLPEEKKAA